MAYKLRLIALACAISVAVVAGHSAAYWALTGQTWDLSNDWWNVGFVAVPFMMLAVLPARRMVPWLVAVALTLLIWGCWLYATVDYFWHPHGGANIGIGFLLAAAPIGISALAAAVHYALDDAAVQA